MNAVSELINNRRKCDRSEKGYVFAYHGEFKCLSGLF